MDIRPDSLPSAAGDSPLPPRISVIVPAYNDPKRLGKCLAALKTSTFTDYEVIVGDDGSTDNTASVAESMGARVVRLPNQAGPAAARNAAIETARGPILMFVDADVCVHPDTLAVAAASFDDPGISAVFGSYDLEPAEPNLLSQYKNLAHRFYHQESVERVSTFWTGCGAMRRDVFNRFKFDAVRFPRPSIEDIDLGAKIARAGGKIIVNKQLQATHLKRWTFMGIIKSDLFDRAIPWTRLIHRDKGLPGDLNLGIAQRLAALLTALSAAIFFVACWFRPWLIAAPVTAIAMILITDRWTERRRSTIATRAIVGALILAGLIAAGWYARWWTLAIVAPLIAVILINHRFYRFFIHHRGWLFAIVAIPMQLAYYLYSLFGFATGTALHWRDTPEHFDNPRVRVRLYAATSTLLYIAAWTLVLFRAHFRNTTIDFAVGDATGFYAYLPSLVIDHDLQFQNQLDIQYPIMDTDYQRDMRHNRWPIGVALSVAPGFLIAHGLALPLHRLTGSWLVAPHGYSPVYFVFVVAWAMMLGTLGMILVDRLIVERFMVPGRFVAAAVMTTWLGTNYLWYFMREPLMAHMVGAAWVIVAIFLAHRIERASREGQLIWWQLPMLAFVTSMALICRISNGFLLPMFIYLAWVLISTRLLPRTFKLLPLIALACLPLLIHAVVTRQIQGKPITAAVEETGHINVQNLGYTSREGFYWTQPALLRSLFSSKHGLFFSTPAYLLAGWGLICALRRRDPLLVSLVISAVLLWYVNSAWCFWWFGPSVGSRGYVELAGLFVIGFSFFFSWLNQVRPRARLFMLVVLALCFLMNYAVMSVKMFDILGDHDSLIPWEDKFFQGRWERL